MPPPSSTGRHRDPRSYPGLNPNFHQQSPESKGSRPDWERPHPCVMFNPVSGLNSSPVFIHPAASIACCKNLTGDGREPQWNRSTTTGYPPNLNATQNFSVSASNDSVTDANICLTAKQLKAQVDDFIKVYAEFYRLYQSEVANIKDYVDDDVLQRAWIKKVEHNEKYNTGRGQEQKQLSTQRKMLSVCLSQMDGATLGSIAIQHTGDASRYDRRSIYLEKIQAAGHRVLRLAEMTTSSRAACGDLRSELSDLGKLVDPKNKEAKIIYEFDRRETLNPQGNNRGDTGNEIQTDNQANEEEVGNIDPQGDNPINDQNDPSSQNDPWSA